MKVNIINHLTETFKYHVVAVGRGFRINLPVSSQDILKSLNTVLVLAVIIEGAMTLLCIPSINKITENVHFVRIT